MANFKFVYGDNLEFVYVIGLESATATVSALLGIAQRKVKARLPSFLSSLLSRPGRFVFYDVGATYIDLPLSPSCFLPQ